MKRVGILPALVTLGNGGCGLLAIYKVHDAKFDEAALLILIAMVFDVLDGMVARRAGITSRFGAYLDSLSDAISFGVAPSFLVKAVLEASGLNIYGPKMLAVMTAIFSLCALVRLARYNVEHTAGEGTGSEGKAVATFAGMPTPGAAGVLASLVFLQQDAQRLVNYDFLLIPLPVLCVVLGFLMVSRVPYVHVGTRFLRVRRDFVYLFVVIVLLVLLIRFPHEVAAVAFVAYGFTGPLLLLRRRHRPPGAPSDRPPLAELNA